MSLTGLRHNVPYKLPENIQDAANKLAEIIGINEHLVHNATPELVNLLCGVILFTHLPDHERYEINVELAQLETSNRVLAAELREKTLDATVSMNWEPWSMTTKELKDIIHGDEVINDWIEKLGFGFDVKSFWEMWKEHKASGHIGGKMKAALILTIAGTLIITLNAYEKSKLEAELKNREPTAGDSKYYDDGG